jgi:integrase
MARLKRAWQKKPWPYRTKSGQRRYRLGYYDHLGVERTISLLSAADADAWAKGYAEAVRFDLLGEFLEANDAPRSRRAVGPDDMVPREEQTPTVSDDITLGEVVQRWLALDAHPDLEDGLAPATFDTHRSVASKHIIGNPWYNARKELQPPVPYAVGHRPAREFSEPGPIVEWLDAMRLAGVGASTRKRARAVLSSALGWAAQRPAYPVTANGAASVTPSTRRRSVRRTGTGRSGASRARNERAAHWALAPEAVERIRKALVDGPRGRPEVQRWRDATIVAIQYDLACRNQDVFALRWRDDCGTQMEIAQAVSYGELDDGKVVGARRSTPIPPTLREVLDSWKRRAAAAGLGTAPDDFIIPGCHRAGHFTRNQAKKWGSDFFKPAVTAVVLAANASGNEELAAIEGATPYALRRGGISLRLREDDEAVVAKHCGTSVQMLRLHYTFAIEALVNGGPRSADEARRAARNLVWGAGSES